MPSNFASSFAIAVIWERLLYCLRVMVMTVVFAKARAPLHAASEEILSEPVCSLSLSYSTPKLPFSQ